MLSIGLPYTLIDVFLPELTHVESCRCSWPRDGTLLRADTGAADAARTGLRGDSCLLGDSPPPTLPERGGF